MNPDFLDLLRAFSAADVRFLIVGAYALALHGRPRATGDRHLDRSDSGERATRDARAGRIRETVNARGHWSSYPPHKHDGKDHEPGLEEMYYYRVSRPEGFGLHISYTASGEAATHQVRDSDLVLIPYGYHSVSAPPRCEFYYLWAIAGDERRLAVYEDPAHCWVHQMNG